MIGEEEAIWVMKLLLPYVNEFLLKLRALFSGDPATTMKVKFKYPIYALYYLILCIIKFELNRETTSHLDFFLFNIKFFLMYFDTLSNLSLSLFYKMIQIIIKFY